MRAWAVSRLSHKGPSPVSLVARDSGRTAGASVLRLVGVGKRAPLDVLDVRRGAHEETRVTKDELTQWQKANSILYVRELWDGRLVGLTPMFYGIRLWVGNTGGWSQAWDYPDMGHAIWAACSYEGTDDPPNGWVRHMRDGQPDRRRPNGDPAAEYVYL